MEGLYLQHNIHNITRGINSSELAEREGFEPSRGLAPPYRFSKPTPSATWVPLRTGLYCNANWLLAEGVGFEPTVPLPARRFSRPFPSTTRTPLRIETLLRGPSGNPMGPYGSSFSTRGAAHSRPLRLLFQYQSFAFFQKNKQPG